MSFSEQKESLEKRQVEQDEAEESIHALITVLDNKKDEAISRTFKQVVKLFLFSLFFFASVFVSVFAFVSVTEPLSCFIQSFIPPHTHIFLKHVSSFGH